MSTCLEFVNNTPKTKHTFFGQVKFLMNYKQMVNSIMFWLLHVLLTFLLRLISFIDSSWSDKTKTFTQMLDLVLWNYKWFVLWISHCNAFFLLCKHLLIHFTTSSGYSCYVCCLSDGIMQVWYACITNINSRKKKKNCEEDLIFYANMHTNLKFNTELNVLRHMSTHFRLIVITNG